MTVAVINCGSRVESGPRLVELEESIEFQFNIIATNESSSFCNLWIEQGRRAHVLSDIRSAIQSELMHCGLQVPCIADDTLTCHNKTNDAKFR